MGKKPNKFKAGGDGAGEQGDEDLAAEVAAFASSLGLGGGGGGGGGAFDDFAPEKAGKKLAPRDGERVDRDRAEAKAKGNKAKNPKAEKGGEAADGGRGKQKGENNEGGKKASQSEPPKASKRDWNFGAGPRPAAITNALASGFGSLDEEGCWYVAAEGLKPLPQVDEDVGEEEEGREEQLRSQAEKLEATAAEAFNARMAKRSSAESRWLQLSRSSGTASDRVAALTLLVQESAVANMAALDQLLKFVTKAAGSKDVVGKAIDALRELFTRVLLPDRPLVLLTDRPLSSLPAHTKLGAQHLLYWHIEDAIKRRYSVFVGALDDRSRDNIDFVKDRALKAAYELLSSKPELEARLLSIVVNKLGDPSRKLASKAGYLLLCLLDQHPGMKQVVIREVERLAFRPNLGERARYYAVVFLNQVVLSHREGQGGGSALARQLLDIYFTIFRLVLSGKAGAQAEAAARAETAGKEGGKDSGRGGRSRGRGRGRGRGREGRGRSRRAPIPEPGKKGSGAALAKFLEMDARLLSGLLAGVRRAFPYVDPDEIDALVDKHAPDLFRIVHSASLNTGVQALLLLHQLMASRSAISDRFYRALYAVLLNPDLPRATKAPMFMSLVLKSMKLDVSTKRITAFSKRLLQVAVEQPPNFACGVLMVLSEVLKVRPGLWQAIMQPEDRSDGLEHFEDADDEDGNDGDRDGQAVDAPKDIIIKVDLPSSDGEEEQGSDESDDDKEEGADDTTAKPPGRDAKAQGQLPKEKCYDMRKREPIFAGAEGSAWWELAALAGHVHPSVAAMARTLLSGAPVVYDGNPLQDMALTPFLDKFIQKKAKSHLRGASLMQPISTPSALATRDVTSAAFSELAKKEVVPADEFFHKYFQLTKQNKPKKKVKRGSDDEMDSGASSGDSDQEDAFLERAEQHTSMGSAPSSGVYDYADLGKAMGRAEKGTGEEEEEGSGVDDDDFDGNVMDLPSPSLSEDDGREEAAGDSDQEDDALAELAKGDDSSDDVEEEEERRGQQKRDSAGRGEAVFASAEDFAEEIEAALARQGRDQGGQGPAGKRKQQEGRSGSPGKPRHPKGRPAKKTKTQRGRKAGS